MNVTTRRTVMSALLGFSAGSVLCGTPLDIGAWRAFEAVEEAWIRDRHALLLEQCPDCRGPASIDLDLKLAELQRRGIQFEYLNKHQPAQLRGGLWELTWIPLRPRDVSRLLSTNAQYRENEDRIQRLTATLRNNPHYDHFRTSQIRLWKTPEYRSAHRRYSGRLYELNRTYSGSVNGSP
ncbi:MAG TPA: hypothetical protein VEX68_13795 [Bryobacteraceae bacterium]|nr:hypothetical protein [Bryobacteraceae bacterium]